MKQYLVNPYLAIASRFKREIECLKICATFKNPRE